MDAIMQSGSTVGLIFLIVVVMIVFNAINK